MGRLRNEEVRRLLHHLRQRIEDAERLAGIEDVLRSDEAEEFLREPELLAYFPELTEEINTIGMQWQLRVIPHAHLRMVQRGITLVGIAHLFRRFVEAYATSQQTITTGPHTIIGRPRARGIAVTLRIDVDAVAESSGRAHVVTIFSGRGAAEGTTEISIP